MESEGPLAPCGDSFGRAVKRLACVAAEVFGESTRVPPACRVLEESFGRVRLAPTHENTLDLIRRFEDVNEQIRRHLDDYPAARAFYAERELHNVTAALFEFCGAAPDAQWLSLPERMDAIPWVHRRKRQYIRDLRRAGCERADLERHEAARLAHVVERLRNSLEYRGRELWVLMRSDGGTIDFSVQELYAWSWADLAGSARVRPQEVDGAARRCRETARRLNLPEIAEFLEPPERVAQYALNYLIPPAPSFWRFECAARVDRFLGGQISRWYLRPFRHSIQPLELVPAVLRRGRPLYYERPAAHAMVQYQIVQAHLPPSVAYFELLAHLERNFKLLFEAYLLRVSWITRLKTAEAWAGYLQELLQLHFGGGAPDVWQREFASERGLRAAHDVLFGPGSAGTVQ